MTSDPAESTVPHVPGTAEAPVAEDRFTGGRGEAPVGEEFTRRRAAESGTEPASAKGNPTPDNEAAQQGPAALERLLAEVDNLRAAAQWYLTARRDQLSLKFRRALLMAFAGVLAGGVALALLVYATVLFLQGIAGGLGVWWGGRFWLGALVTGAAVLTGLGMGIYFLVYGKSSVSRKTVDRYEEFQKRSRGQQ